MLADDRYLRSIPIRWCVVIPRRGAHLAATAIGTLRFTRKLKQVGFPSDQAAALGEELTEHLATRADLLPVKWMLGFNLAFSATILWRILDLA